MNAFDASVGHGMQGFASESSLDLCIWGESDDSADMLMDVICAVISI